MSLEFSNLTGKILIAAPHAMKGSIYYQSIIYVIYHSPNGAIGFIFNHETGNLPMNTIFKEYIGNNPKLNSNIGVHIGGISDLQHAFFLHSNDYQENLLVNDHCNQLCISSHPQILTDISQNIGPEKMIFIIGYTAWNKGQMEDEIINGLWVVSEPNHDLIFRLRENKSWSEALNIAGIQKNTFILQTTNSKN